MSKHPRSMRYDEGTGSTDIDINIDRTEFYQPLLRS
jgi:hypothetical protein